MLTSDCGDADREGFYTEKIDSRTEFAECLKSSSAESKFGVPPLGGPKDELKLELQTLSTNQVEMI
jgi:hypothetical protein